MDSEKKHVDAEVLKKIEYFELKESKKKKKKGWRPSKLDCVSDVLLELRRRGTSLQSMANFLQKEFQISIDKSNVQRFFDKLKIKLEETSDGDQ